MNTAAQALSIASNHIGTSEYQLGTGDMDTPRGGKFDCFGFAVNKCYQIRRHRPGFNRGAWATVSDDLNCNSAIEDAQHHQELFVEVAKDDIQPGDLLAYPTFTVYDANHQPHKFIGHIGMVDFISSRYKTSKAFTDLAIIQCHGPNGRRPGITVTDGAIWDQHDHVWPKPEHRTHILRVKVA